MEKSPFYSGLTSLIVIAVVLLFSCQKKVPDPSVQTQNQVSTSTSGTTTNATTTSGSTTNGTTTNGSTTSPTVTVPTTGRVMFYISEDQGCGNITVTINGVNKFITSYYDTSTPDCGALGCATFELAPGSYTFAANCTGTSWGAGTTFTVTAGACHRRRLL